MIWFAKILGFLGKITQLRNFETSRSGSIKMDVSQWMQKFIQVMKNFKQFHRMIWFAKILGFLGKITQLRNFETSRSGSIKIYVSQ